jgi:hypothetical protein
VDARLHHLQGKAEGVTPTELARLLTDFYIERLALLQRHEEVARCIADYDINNGYQFAIAREETHASWLQHALVDLGAPVPADPPGPALPSVRGDGWQALAAEDALNNARFVEKWRPRVDAVTHARHRGMLQVVLGEMLEHQRLFEQAAAGRRDLIGVSMPIHDHSGTVLGTRWVE